MSKRWTESLPVTLTNAELLERGESLALMDSTRAEKETERKRAADGFKHELEDIAAEQSRLAMIVRDKREARPVYVTEIRDFKKGSVDIVREDTAEAIRTRVMTEHERQMELIPTIEAVDTTTPALSMSEFHERLEGAIQKAHEAKEETDRILDKAAEA